jgi:glucan phosphoethanolaminetransferase (alkaline phosphatase superfamily)
MRERDVIRNQVLENIERRSQDRHSNVDELNFLITVKVTESAFFELREPVTLKNSLKKKIVNYLVWGVLEFILIYLFIKYSYFKHWWMWIVLILLLFSSVSYFVKFLANKSVLEFSSVGLTLDGSIFNKWEDIEFLYFKTKYDGNNSYEGTYLVEKLKNGKEHELQIDDLPWSTDQLGRILYQCMKRYGN